MSKVAFVFPGQGSQYVGMGKDLFDTIDAAREKFIAAKELLGFDLASICFNGAAEQLTNTGVAQPALFTISAILTDELAKKGIKADIVAGHSLGEYSALYAAGVFDFITGLSLVSKRAAAMKKATNDTPGTMAAIMGMELSQVEEVCKEASSKGVAKIANINSLAQIVISGDKVAIDEAVRIAQEKGAQKAIPLAVSGAFHSPLMKPAQDEMKDVIENTELAAPKIDFIANVTADFVGDPSEIKKLLLEQITGSVQWVATINKMAASGVTKIVEVGAGKVLCGLIKRIDKSIALFNVENTETLNAIEEKIK